MCERFEKAVMLHVVPPVGTAALKVQLRTGVDAAVSTWTHVVFKLQFGILRRVVRL